MAQELHETKTADNVEALDKVAVFDAFFAFLQRLGIMPLLQQLDPGTRLRASISWVAMVGVDVMRILAGVPSIPQTEGLLLTDPALMALFGMAAFVEKGTTRRGLSRANKLPAVRGAFSGEARVDALAQCSLVVLARVFNAVIGILAERGYFPTHVPAVVDGPDLEAPPKYRMRPSWQPPVADGAQGQARPRERVGPPVACVKRKKRPDQCNTRHAPKVETTVWGWKVWVMVCPTSGLPIAMYVDRINGDDRTWMLALVHQGKANIGERLEGVVFDRGAPSARHHPRREARSASLPSGRRHCPGGPVERVHLPLPLPRARDAGRPASALPRLLGRRLAGGLRVLGGCLVAAST